MAQHRLGESGWVQGGGVFWFRIFGWGFYFIRGERPYLLRPGLPPKRQIPKGWEGPK